MASVISVATSIQRFIAAFVVEPLLILFLGIFFGKLAEQAIIAAARELKVESPSIILTARTLAWSIYILAVGLALLTLHLLWYVLSILTIVLTVVLAASLLLGLKDFFPNVSRHHAIKAKYKRGSTMKTTFGDMTVVSVQLLDTHCTSPTGDNIYVPNRSVPLGRKS